MKVSEVIENLQNFMEKHGDINCWYAVDDEGNAHHPVYFKPSRAYYNDDYGMMYEEEDLAYCGLHRNDVELVCVIN